jgi:hypothetical protein
MPDATGATLVTARPTIVSSTSVALTVRPTYRRSNQRRAAVEHGWSSRAAVDRMHRAVERIGKAIHSAAGSKASVGLVSPGWMADLRRSAL